MKTNLTKFAVIWAKRRQNGQAFWAREAPKSHSQRKRKEEKERARRKKGGEEKKAMVALLVFIMASFGGNVSKDPLTYI